MKIIEMLDKMAKGEINTKTKVSYKNARGKHENWESLDYYIHDELGKRCESEFKDFLNDEIEIIEEDKKIKMLEPVRGSDLTDLTSKDVVLKNNALIELCKTLNNINNKVNELICEANKLKGKK